MIDRIRLRRDSAAAWEQYNPVLATGEPGVELDTNKIKIGNGILSWNDLPYMLGDLSGLKLSIGNGLQKTIDWEIDEQLNFIGLGDTSVSFDNTSNKIYIYSSGTLPDLTNQDITNALGYTPQITGSYALSTHNHEISDVANLQNELNSKQPTGSYAPLTHSHGLYDIIGLVSQLNNKQPLGSYAESDHIHELSISVLGINNKLSYNTNDTLRLIPSGFISLGFDDATNSIVIGTHECGQTQSFGDVELEQILFKNLDGDIVGDSGLVYLQNSQTLNTNNITAHSGLFDNIRVTGSIELDDNVATKAYIDSIKNTLDFKTSVKAASIAPFASIGAVFSDGQEIEYYQPGSLPGIDGITLTTGDRILITEDRNYNGIYEVIHTGDATTPWLLRRSEDANSNDKLNPGAFVFVEDGRQHHDTGWVLTSNSVDINGQQDIIFKKASNPNLSYGSGLYQYDELIQRGLLYEYYNIINVGQGDGIKVLENSVSVDSTVLRTTGVQTIEDTKDFGNNLRIKPIYNPNNVNWFPAFNFDPATQSQKLIYIDRSDLVNILSLEDQDFDNLVNTTGIQTISGKKTFVNKTFFNYNYDNILYTQNRFQAIGAVNLWSTKANFITFNASGISDPPLDSSTLASGTKIFLKPSPLTSIPPISIGLSDNSMWHTLHGANWNYEWYAGFQKVGELKGDGTFGAKSISGVNFYLNNEKIISTASELNLLSTANTNQILIGSGNDFIKRNIIDSLNENIFSQSGISIEKTSNSLNINHNWSTANSTNNGNGYVVNNIDLDIYGHITGISSINLDARYVTSESLYSQLVFTSGIDSFYDSASGILSVYLEEPSSVTLTSNNAVTSDSHTHSFAPGGTDEQYITGDGALNNFPNIFDQIIINNFSFSGDMEGVIDGGTVT